MQLASTICYRTFSLLFNRLDWFMFERIFPRDLTHAAGLFFLSFSFCILFSSNLMSPPINKVCFSFFFIHLTFFIYKKGQKDLLEANYSLMLKATLYFLFLKKWCAPICLRGTNWMDGWKCAVCATRWPRWPFMGEIESLNGKAFRLGQKKIKKKINHLIPNNIVIFRRMLWCFHIYVLCFLLFIFQIKFCNEKEMSIQN